MATEAELTTRLHEILSTADLNTTTTTTVRRKLEEDFGIDLSDKKAFIRESIDLYLQNQENVQEQQQEEEEEPEEDEEVEDGESEEEADELEEEPRKRRSVVKKRSKKKDTEVKKRGGGGGFTKPCGLSPELQKITGAPELGRTEVVKKLWIYIREHDLQDPANRRNIVCDDSLRELFGVDTINMFQMNKSLTKHIWPLDSTCAVESSSPAKEKQQKQDREEDSEESNRKEKRQKSGNTGIHAPISLSEPLMKFFGTGETALPRSDVIRRVWVYIKQNELQDPSDKRRILCDEKLQELFNVDQFVGFSMAKLLKDHFIKSEQ